MIRPLAKLGTGLSEVHVGCNGTVYQGLEDTGYCHECYVLIHAQTSSFKEATISTGDVYRDVAMLILPVSLVVFATSSTHSHGSAIHHSECKCVGLQAKLLGIQVIYDLANVWTITMPTLPLHVSAAHFQQPKDLARYTQSYKSKPELYL